MFYYKKIKVKKILPEREVPIWNWYKTNIGQVSIVKFRNIGIYFISLIVIRTIWYNMKNSFLFVNHEQWDESFLMPMCDRQGIGTVEWGRQLTP